MSETPLTYRCSRCDYQMWDATPADAEAHVLSEHAHNVVVIRHDHGPGPSLDCPDCQKALAEYDAMGEPQ